MLRKQIGLKMIKMFDEIKEEIISSRQLTHKIMEASQDHSSLAFLTALAASYSIVLDGATDKYSEDTINKETYIVILDLAQQQLATIKELADKYQKELDTDIN